MRTSREAPACTLRTRTTSSRLEAPRTTATSERETPSCFAGKRSASALALPSLRSRKIPSFAVVREPLLLTPAQEAAGPEDAAVPPVSFGGGSPIEELLRAALLGQGRLLALDLLCSRGLFDGGL